MDRIKIQRFKVRTIIKTEKGLAVFFKKSWMVIFRRHIEEVLLPFEVRGLVKPGDELIIHYEEKNIIVIIKRVFNGDIMLKPFLK